MRKTALKKKNPDRHKAILISRENNDLTYITDYNGNTIALNPLKRYLLNKPYKHWEYKAELGRKLGEINNILREKKNEKPSSD